VTEREQRPIDKDDYERVYIVLMAMKLKAVLGEDRPLWEILRDIREENARDDSRLMPGDLVGDEAASVEVTHALIVMEQLMRGSGTVPAGPALASQTVCSVSGCPNLTTTALCLQHELEHG
jgi:hypothetical protein